MTNEQLVLRIQANENTSENMLELWKQNKGYICTIASKYTLAAETDDLEQEGFIALCEAVENYDISRGMSFMNYASFYLHKCFRTCVSNNRLIHVPSWASDELRKYKVIVREYEKTFGFKPSDAELKTLLGVNNKKLDSIKETALKCDTQSLNDVVSNEVEELTLEDTIASDVNIEEDVIERIDRERMKNEVWIAVDRLPAEQGNILKMRYKDNETRKNVGAALQISEHRVRTEEKNALESLKTKNYKGVLHKYYEEYIGAVDVIYKGVGAFNRTWTSTTEQQALNNMKFKEKSERTIEDYVLMLEERRKLVYG